MAAGLPEEEGPHLVAAESGDASRPQGGPEDEELRSWVLAARGGDLEAFDRIVRRFESRVVAVAYTLVGRREDAEEVAQEAFLRAFRYLRRFRSGRRFTPWLMRIVVHAAYAQMKRERSHRLRVVPLEGGPGDAGGPAEPAAPAPSAEEAAIGGERREELLAALGGLAPQERAAFVLRELQGLSTAETAEALGVRPVTVRRHVSRAFHRLRDLLGGP